MGPAAAAIIPAVIGAAGTIYAAHKASKDASSSRKLQQQSIDEFGRQINTLDPLGQSLMSQGQSALSPAIRRFTRLSGSAPEALNELSPELNARATQDRAALAANAEVAPRGGTSSDFLSRLPFMRIGETGNMLTGARSDAASRLAGIGSGLIGQGLNAFGGAAGAAGMGLNFGLDQSKFLYGQAQDLGNTFAQLARSIGNYYQNRNTTTTTTTKPTNDPTIY